MSQLDGLTAGQARGRRHRSDHCQSLHSVNHSINEKGRHSNLGIRVSRADSVLLRSSLLLLCTSRVSGREICQ